MIGRSRRIILFIFCVVMALVIAFLSYKIRTDMDYHSGKDNGFFVRLKSIVLFSVLFYAAMGRRKILMVIYALMGFVAGIAAAFAGLLIANYTQDILLPDHGIVFHIVGSILVVASFYLAEKIFNRLNGHNTTAHTIS